MKLSDDVKFVLLMLAVFASMIAAFMQPNYSAVFYDCRIAEISPDVPPKVKEECRRKMEKKPWLRPQGSQ